MPSLGEFYMGKHRGNNLEQVGWDRRAGARKKRGGSWEKRGREAGGQRWQEPGEIEKYFAIEMGQRIGNQEETKYGKGREAGVKGTGSRSRRYRKREVKTPLSPPTNNGDHESFLLSSELWVSTSIHW